MPGIPLPEIADISYPNGGRAVSVPLQPWFTCHKEGLMPRVTEDLTLPAAADLYGYRSDSTLRTAAREGKLRTKRLGPRAIVTTEAWVDDYHFSQDGRGRPRGRPQPERP